MKTRRFVSLFLCSALLMLPAAVFAGIPGVRVGPGTMLHARQVLERYDAAGEPVLQYLELWADAARALQREVGADGRALACAFSRGDEHITWDAATLRAARQDASGVFLPDFAALKAGFVRETAVSGQEYAGRPCSAVLLEDPANEEDWLRVFVDDETGFVLFCEAPLFRLRTSLMEILPADERLLLPPDGLVF